MKGSRALLLAVTCALIAAASFSLPVDYDEAYYWTWSRALEPSYADHPPGVAWSIAASVAVFGSNKLALRVLALASVAAIGLLLRATVARLVPNDRRREAGEQLLLGLSGSLMFTLGYLPATPDPLQGAALAAAAYVLVRALEPDTSRVWPGLLVPSFSAAMLIKHSSACLAFGALLSLCATPSGRRLLLRPALWVGAGLGGLALVLWLGTDLGPAQGATLFQARRVFFERPSRGLLALPLLLGSMALSFGPGAAALQLTQIGAALRGRRGAAELALASGAFAMLLACLIAAWFGGGELNWPMPALIFGLPAAVAFAITAASGLGRWYTWASLVATLMSWLVLAHVIMPFLPIPAEKDRTLRAAGFERVSERAQALAGEHGARLFVTRRYQAASMLRWYGADALPVLELGSGRLSQYDRWPRPRACRGDVAVAVFNHPNLPEELSPVATALAAPTDVVRERSGRTIDHWYATPIRFERDLAGAVACPGGAP